jgi:hypothetical protein
MIEFPIKFIVSVTTVFGSSVTWMSDYTLVELWCILWKHDYLFISDCISSSMVPTTATPVVKFVYLYILDKCIFSCFCSNLNGDQGI